MPAFAELKSFPFKCFLKEKQRAIGPLHESSLLTMRLQRQQFKLLIFFYVLQTPN